jgi:type VI secretion system secreted protein VgrG
MADFSTAIVTVLKNEGGLVDAAGDSGGLTNMGISQAAYPNVDIRNLTVEQACTIYQRDYWLFGGVDCQDVATKLLDAYVNMKHNAIRIAQRICGVAVDGSYGPATEAAINDRGEDFLPAFRQGLVNYYTAIAAANPAEQKFLAGWLRRAAQ